MLTLDATELLRKALVARPCPTCEDPLCDLARYVLKAYDYECTNPTIKAGQYVWEQKKEDT